MSPRINDQKRLRVSLKFEYQINNKFLVYVPSIAKNETYLYKNSTFTFNWYPVFVKFNSPTYNSIPFISPFQKKSLVNFTP
jgi:hypothetical protein